MQNSEDLVSKLTPIKVEEDESIISFDISALFTSVPVEESITLILERLEADLTLSDRTSLSPQQAMDLLRMCLTTTYFKYDGVFYSQIEGAAMGSLVSPIVANLFMEWFEDRALMTYRDPPRFWGWYMDDGLAVIKTHAIESFAVHLNSQHPNIKWTSELEQDGTLPMLDTLVSRSGDGTLKFRVYRKPTHTDQYLQFNSHQPMEHKMGVIRTLTHRANAIIMEEEDKEEEYKHIKKVLSIAGYSKWAWQAPGRRKIHPHPSHRDRPRPKGHVTLPYMGGITEPISRLIRKAGVAVHSKPHTTIRSILVAPKDRDDPVDKCGVVYHLTCQDCDAHYIGETERALKTRLKEHNRDSSPVGHHMYFHQHKLDTDNIKILD